MKNQNQKEKEKKNKLLKNWAFFTGIALQMMIVIGGSVWLGIWLDEKFNNEFPLLTVILSLLGVFAALAQVLIALKKYLN
ncbi:MAG: AtpZ/AtpI family protein [Bacteroidota bacterium]